MVSCQRYVPVLPVKRGELRALSALEPDVRAGMTPLFVVPAGEHASEAVTAVARHWGAAPAFADLAAAGDEPTPYGLHPLADAFRAARALGLLLVPVTSLAASGAHRTAAGEVAAVDGRGVCLRVHVRDWPALGPDGALTQVLGELRLPPRQVDLVLDLAGHARSARATVELARTLAALPWRGAWRSLIVTGTGYPSPRESPEEGITEVPRAEWAGYLHLRNLTTARLPTFGDYGVTHPDAVAVSSRYFHDVWATLRYTTSDTWVLVRGELYAARDGGGIGAAAVPPLAEMLRSHPRFDFAQHCPMESWVAQVAYVGSGGGNPETWHQLATHHHLVVVREQLDRVTEDIAHAYRLDG